MLGSSMRKALHAGSRQVQWIGGALGPIDARSAHVTSGVARLGSRCEARIALDLPLTAAHQIAQVSRAADVQLRDDRPHLAEPLAGDEPRKQHPSRRPPARLQLLATNGEHLAPLASSIERVRIPGFEPLHAT